MFSPAQKLSYASHHKGYNATFKVPSEETLFHNYPPPSRFGETGWELSCAPVFKFDSAVSFHLHVQCKQISCPFSLYYPKDTSKDPPLAIQYRSHKLIKHIILVQRASPKCVSYFICLLKFQIHLSLLLCLTTCILIYLICTLCSLLTCRQTFSAN